MGEPDLAAEQQLYALLTKLKKRRGLSYEQLGERAACSRSTAQNYLAKPRYPRNEVVLKALLAALDATDAEFGEALRLLQLSSPEPPDPVMAGWTARASAAQCTVWEMAQFTPAEATVHPAINRGHAPSNQPGVVTPPPYVARDHDALLRADIDAAARGDLSALIVLRGAPSTGKTRSLFEAVHALGPQWAVVRPRSAAALRDLAQSQLLAQRQCVLWLNELQIFLGSNGTGLSLDVLRDLFRATNADGMSRPRHPLVAVATLWPEKLRNVTSGGDDRSDNRELLTANEWVRWHEVPRDFSDQERSQAYTLAANSGDDRLSTALANPDRVGFTQTLAGSLELIEHYRSAPDVMSQLLLDAAGDARRLGHSRTLPGPLLRAIAIALWREQRGPTSPPPGWFETAVAYATQPLRSTDGVQALIPVDHVDSGAGDVPAGYDLADYLEHHLALTRRTRRVSDAIWIALQRDCATPDDLVAVAASAVDRGRFQHAEALYRTVGTRTSMHRLVKLLERQPGREAEVEQWYRDAIMAGDRNALGPFLAWLAGHGRDARVVPVCRDAIAAGNSDALLTLAYRLPPEPGYEKEVEQAYRDAVAAGVTGARQALIDWLDTQPGGAPEIEQIYRDARDPMDLVLLANWLGRQPGRESEAEQAYRDAAVMNGRLALAPLAEWLAHQPGREADTEQTFRDALEVNDEERTRFARWLESQPGREAEAMQHYRDAIAAGDRGAWQMLVGWLRSQPGRNADIELAYRDAIAAGDYNAPGQLAEWLSTQPGREADVEQVYRDAIAAGDCEPIELAEWLSMEPGREADVEQAYRDAVAAGDRDALSKFADWLEEQPGREADAVKIFSDAAVSGDPYALRSLGGWLALRPGRELEAEQAYRDAVAAGEPQALGALASWLGRQSGREAEAEQAYRDAVDAGESDAVFQFGLWLQQQPGRGDDAKRMRQFGLDGDYRH